MTSARKRETFIEVKAKIFRSDKKTGILPVFLFAIISKLHLEPEVAGSYK